MKGSESLHRRNDLDLLNGSLWDKALLFALPLAATGILQQLFNAADIAVVGRLVGKTAMAAVGSNSPVIGLLINLLVGISLGSNVAIANAIGAGDRETARKTAHTSLVIAFVGGVIAALLGELLAAPVLTLMQVPESVYPMALLYLRVYLLGLPVVLLYNFESSIFRAQGDTRTPLIALASSGVLNVGLNLFFVWVVGMTVDGVALATALSNGFSAVLLFCLLHRKGREGIRITFSELRPDPYCMRRIFRIGIPAGLQSSVFSLSNICVQSAINSLGETVMAASSAAFNLEIFSYYLLNSFGQACTTIVGQNHGAGRTERCDRTLRICLLEDYAVWAILCAVMLFFCDPLLSIFNTDPEVIEIGRVRMFYIFFGHAFSILMECGSGYLRGFGMSTIPAVLSLLFACGTRILWVYTAFAAAPSFARLMAVYPLSLSLTGCTVMLGAILYRRHLKRLMES